MIVFDDSNRASPASRITGLFPSFFTDSMYFILLGRPPMGFFFHPQGSS
jgi:hypothetical protein